jgi:D-glycero-D-manno-heptose 1,7-bisphosphate phosphatase
MRTVFLDRDGVINENRPDHVKCWDEFSFLPGALDAIARLGQAGFRVFVITNQAVINRGLVPRDIVDAINSRMVLEIERHGGRVEQVVYCPHRPEEECHCRKPRPGLLLETAERYGLNLQEAVVVGDSLSDIEAGQAVGCQTVLVLTGRGRDEWRQAAAASRNGFSVADDLSHAVDLVLVQSALLAH